MQSYRWETVPAEALDERVTRRMIVGAKEMVVHWTFKQGALASMHQHPHEQVVMMLTGKLKLTVGGEETVMGPGDLVLIPPDVPHQAEALEDTEVIDIFAPPREDFLSAEGPAYLRK